MRNVLLQLASQEQPHRTTYVLGAAEGDTGDAGDVLQAKLSDSLTSLLLVTRVDSDGGAAGNGSLALASIGVGVAALLNVGLGDLVIGEFFNTGIGHF